MMAKRRVFHRRNKTHSKIRIDDGVTVGIRPALITWLAAFEKEAPTYWATVTAQVQMSRARSRYKLDSVAWKQGKLEEAPEPPSDIPIVVDGEEVGTLEGSGELRCSYPVSEVAGICTFLACVITELDGWEDEAGDPVSWQGLGEDEKVELVELLADKDRLALLTGETLVRLRSQLGQASKA